MLPKGNKGENYIIKTVALSPQRHVDQDKFQYIVYSSKGEAEWADILMTRSEQGKTEEHPTFIVKASLIFLILSSSFWKQYPIPHGTQSSFISVVHNLLWFTDR